MERGFQIMTFRRLLLGLVTLTVIGAMAQTASATIITINMDTEFSGATPPAGPPPWATATFNDFGGTGSVLLTLSAAGLVGTEFIADWFFNVDVADPSLVVITANDISALDSFTTIQGLNCCQANGDGDFDIQFNLDPPPGPPNPLTSGETVSFFLTFPGLTADSFAVGSAANPGGGLFGLFSAAHVQSIGTGGEFSGWVTGDEFVREQGAPEPGSLFILGAGLVSLGLIGGARRSKK